MSKIAWKKVMAVICSTALVGTVMCGFGHKVTYAEGTTSEVNGDQGTLPWEAEFYAGETENNGDEGTFPWNDEFTTTAPETTPSDSAAQSATAGEKNALSKAKEYLDFMAFSHDGLVEQLEYEGFSYSEAVYGADHCGADWMKQAVKKAKEYLDFMSFSSEGLIEQLEYEGFTHEQAVYGAEQNGF